MRLLLTRLAVALAILFTVTLTLPGPSLGIEMSQSARLPRPAELEADVQFWIRIYSEVETSAGFHLFKALEATPAQVPPLEQVRPSIESALRGMRERELRQNMIAEQMAAQNAQIFDDAFGAPPAASQPAAPPSVQFVDVEDVENE